MRIDADGLLDGFVGYDPLALGLAPGACLIVDFTGSAAARRADLGPAAMAWLASLPGPAAALADGPAGRPGEVPGFDLTLRSAAEADRLAAAVAANPQAATVLVQTLRLVEQLPPLAALTVESLAFAALQQGEEFRCWHAALAAGPRPAPTGPPLLVSRKGDALHLVLNRPETRNAVDVALRDALFDAFALAAFDGEIRRVEVTGAGDSFCTGGALGDFGQATSAAAAHLIRTERLPARMLAVAGHKVQVHLHGACVGAGVEMAAFAGRVTADPAAFLRLPEVAMGLIPGAGGTVGITRRIGRQAAAWLMLTGQRIGARTALKLGLVDEIAVRAPPEPVAPDDSTVDPRAIAP